jgi:putative transposase
MLDLTKLEDKMAKRFKKEEIVKTLKEAEQMGSVRDVIRIYNASEQSFYRWRQKYGALKGCDRWKY